MVRVLPPPAIQGTNSTEIVLSVFMHMLQIKLLVIDRDIAGESAPCSCSSYTTRRCLLTLATLRGVA